MNYHDYLQLEKILTSQTPESERVGRASHDEMLFIITHQAYELWFKQILFELESIKSYFEAREINDRDMNTIVLRLERVISILIHLVDQVKILETMTPLDFLEFRDLLVPASGFQSFQFRQIELILGLKREQRHELNQKGFTHYLKPKQADLAQKLEASPSLFDHLQRWLERTPFLQTQAFDFWDEFQKVVHSNLHQDREMIEKAPNLTEISKQKSLEQVKLSSASFASLFDEKVYLDLKNQGQWRFSLKALKAILFIQLYRDEPALHLPFRLLSLLSDLDEWLTTWRHRHALMAKRMIGSRVGTGGSSGFDYLKKATEEHRVFQDLNRLTTFLIPRSQLPPLPPQLKQSLAFHYSNQPE